MTWIQFLKPKRLPFSSGDYIKYKHTSVMVKKDNNHYFCQRKSHPFRLVETFSWHPQHLAFWRAFSRTHRSTSWFWKAPWITPLAPRAKGHHTPWHPWASICYSINIKLATKSFFFPLGFPFWAACCTQKAPCTCRLRQKFSVQVQTDTTVWLT